MVYGIGCDLCSIARMEKSLLGPHGAVFARRVFGPAEQAALGLPLAEEEGTARRTAHTVAARRRTLRPRRLSSRRRAPVCGIPSPSARSKPSACPAGHRPIAFPAGGAQWVEAHRLRAHLSLSHEDGMAMAYCILETET